MRTVFFCIVVILLLGCNKPNKPPLSLEEVKALICGNYQGKYNKGIEYFEIKPDGAFSQAFVQTGVTNYRLEGKWSFEKMEDRYLVRFTPFMDFEEAILKGKSPERINSRTATFYDDDPGIYFFRDIDYLIVKQSDKGQTNELQK